MKQVKRALFVVTIIMLLPGCGRFGFDDQGPVQGLAASDPQALVGCANAIISDPTGQGYAVVWHEYPAPGGTEHSLMFAFVDSSERMLEGPLVIDRLDGVPTSLRIFTRENGYTVFYRFSGGDTLYAVRLDATGQLQTHEAVGTYESTLFVVQNDSGFGVFFEEDNELYFAPLDEQAVEVAPVTLVPVPPDANGDAVLEVARAVYLANGYHLVFEHRWGAGLGYLHLDDDGAIIDYTILDFGSHRSPQIATDGTGRMAVTWFEGEQLIEYGMDASGAPLWNGIRQLLPMNRQESLTRSMAGGAGQIALVWESDVDSVLPQIMFRFYGLDGIEAQGSAESISPSDYAFSCPHVAQGDEHSGIAFRGQVEGSQQLFVRVRHD